MTLVQPALPLLSSAPHTLSHSSRSLYSPRDRGCCITQVPTHTKHPQRWRESPSLFISSSGPRADNSLATGTTAVELPIWRLSVSNSPTARFDGFSWRSVRVVDPAAGLEEMKLVGLEDGSGRAFAVAEHTLGGSERLQCVPAVSTYLCHPLHPRASGTIADKSLPRALAQTVRSRTRSTVACASLSRCHSGRRSY